MNRKVHWRDYPQHEKMEKITHKSQAIGEFLEWLKGRYEIAEWDTGGQRDQLQIVRKRTEELLAEYFEIDLDLVEREKLEMLDKIREANAKEG